MPEQPIDIQIFGRTLRINCPSQKKIALNKAAEDLDQRLKILKNKTKVTNVEQLVFIAALNVCHELFQEKSKTLEYAANIKKHIHTLQQTINQALISHDYITENSNEYFECSKKTNTIK